MTKIVLDYYKGKDFYSDGVIEDEILAIVEKCNGSQTELEKIVHSDKRWPILYHLSSERHMLLNPFPLKREARLLEVGAGCGALTGLFLKKVSNVTAIELSLKRSKIIEQRFKNYGDKLEIIVGNLFDIPPKKQYEYATLIGVLEYANMICPTNNPVVAMLKQVRQWMLPDATLFIAIENRFGLKYFAGCREDHTGKLFQSIEGYPFSSKVITLSKSELSTSLSEAGFVVQEFYYPYPDYKLPSEIFSDNFLPSLSHTLPEARNFDFDRVRLFSEVKAWHSIIKNNMFPFFANSFLVLARAL